jgi:iron complex outermembrane receptor protein
MRSRLRTALLVGGSAAALFIASAGHAQESDPQAAGGGQAASGGGIETVVVTARRREENAQNVPVAVTAFSSADLEAHSFSRPQDLIASVPSIYVFGQNRDDAEAEKLTHAKAF